MFSGPPSSKTSSLCPSARLTTSADASFLRKQIEKTYKSFKRTLSVEGARDVRQKITRCGGRLPALFAHGSIQKTSVVIQPIGPHSSTLSRGGGSHSLAASPDATQAQQKSATKVIRKRLPTRLPPSIENQLKALAASDILRDSGCPEDTRLALKRTLYSSSLSGVEQYAIPMKVESVIAAMRSCNPKDVNVTFIRRDRPPISLSTLHATSVPLYTLPGHDLGVPMDVDSLDADGDCAMTDQAPIMDVAQVYYGSDDGMGIQYYSTKPAHVGSFDVEMSDAFDLLPQPPMCFVTPAVPAPTHPNTLPNEDPSADIHTAACNTSFVLPAPTVAAPAPIAVPDVPDVPATPIQVVLEAPTPPTVITDVPAPPAIAPPPATIEAATTPASQAKAAPAALDEPSSFSASGEPAPASTMTSIPSLPPATSPIGCAPSLPPVPLPPVPDLCESPGSLSSSDIEPEVPRTPTTPVLSTTVTTETDVPKIYEDTLADLVFGNKSNDGVGIPPSIRNKMRQARAPLKDLHRLQVLGPAGLPSELACLPSYEHSVSGPKHGRQAHGVSPYAGARKMHNAKKAAWRSKMETGTTYMELIPPPPVISEAEHTQILEGLEAFDRAQNTFMNAMVGAGLMDAAQFNPVQIADDAAAEDLSDYVDEADDEDDDDNSDGDESDDDVEIIVTAGEAPVDPAVIERAAVDLILSASAEAEERLGGDAVMA